MACADCERRRAAMIKTLKNWDKRLRELRKGKRADRSKAD